jgi:hypothetical protein
VAERGAWLAVSAGDRYWSSHRHRHHADLKVENARYVVGLIEGGRVVVNDVAETGVVRTVVADARRLGAEVVEADVRETARVDENESAAEPSSLAKPSQAVAASRIGEEPGPAGTVAGPKRHHP